MESRRQHDEKRIKLGNISLFIIIIIMKRKILYNAHSELILFPHHTREKKTLDVTHIDEEMTNHR